MVALSTVASDFSNAEESLCRIRNKARFTDHFLAIQYALLSTREPLRLRYEPGKVFSQRCLRGVR